MNAEDYRPRNVSEVYERVADRYESGLWGWIQGDIQFGTAMTLPNAIHTAAHCHVDVKLCYEAITYAQEKLGVWLRQWNDEMTRTKGEVIDKLRELAKLYRDQELMHGSTR